MLLAQLSGLRLQNMAKSIKTEPSECTEYQRVRISGRISQQLQSAPNYNTNCSGTNGVMEGNRIYTHALDQSTEGLGTPPDVRHGGEEPLEEYNTLQPDTYAPPSQSESSPSYPLHTFERVTKNCHHCGKLFRHVSRKFYNQHIRAHKYRAPLKCSLCGMSFRSYHGREFHYQWAQCQDYVEYAESSNGEESQTPEDRRANEPLVNFQASANDEGSSNHSDSLDLDIEEESSDLMDSEATDENEDPSDPMDSQISEGEDSANYQVSNISKKTYTSRYPCSVCGQVFSSSDDCLKHVYQYHVRSSRTRGGARKVKYDCGVCGKTFELRFLLNRHQKLAHNKKA